MTDLNRDWALRLAEAGVSVFPCGSDKRPLVKSWYDLSSTDPATITKWWTQNPHALPAIALGKVDLFVLDGDRHGSGPDGCAALFELLRDADIGDAPIVETPNNGVHVYFKQDGHDLGNAEGSLPDGINARGRRGYTIAPYTNLPDGRCYHAAEGAADFISAFTNGLIPNVPQAVVDLIKREDEPQPSNFTFTADTTTRETAYAAAALKGSADELAATASGRNNTLNGAAFRMGRMIARGWIGRSTVEDALTDAMRRNGYEKEEGRKAVKATLKSGLDAGLADPHPDLQERPPDDQKKYEDDAPEKTLEIQLEDFVSYMPMHRTFSSRRGKCGQQAASTPVCAVTVRGLPKPMPPSLWLDRNRAVEQMTWAPASRC